MDEQILKNLKNLQQKYDDPLVDYGNTYYKLSDVNLDIYPESVYFWLSYDNKGRIQRCGTTENIKKTIGNMEMQQIEYYISIHEVIVDGSKKEKLIAIKDYKQQLRRALKV